MCSCPHLGQHLISALYPTLTSRPKLVYALMIIINSTFGRVICRVHKINNPVQENTSIITIADIDRLIIVATLNTKISLMVICFDGIQYITLGHTMYGYTALLISNRAVCSEKFNSQTCPSINVDHLCLLVGSCCQSTKVMS